MTIDMVRLLGDLRYFSGAWGRQQHMLLLCSCVHPAELVQPSTHHRLP